MVSILCRSSSLWPSLVVYNRELLSECNEEVLKFESLKGLRHMEAKIQDGS